MRTPIALLLTAAALTLSACGEDNTDTTSTATATPAAASTPAATTAEASSPAGDDAKGDGPPGHCEKVAAPQPKKTDVPKPTGSLDPNKAYYVVLKTSCGTIRILLDQRNSPKTANAFASLVKAGFYDGLGFHRVVPGWVVQGGDPDGTGAGGPGWSVVEAPPKDASYDRGTVAMAKTQTEAAGTSGSQFFIVIAQDAQLPPDYAIAGTVKTGRQVADAMAKLSSGADGPPTQPIVISKATLEVH